MSLDCLFCSENKPIQECQHTFCLKCLTKLKLAFPEGEINVICPSDTSKTISNEQQGLPKLRTYFGKRLNCDECLEQSFVEKCWWCTDCQTTLCSNCAMENHKDHSCKHWDLIEFAKKCTAIYQEYALLAVDTSAGNNSNGPSSLEDKVHAYCVQLEDELKRRFDFSIQSQRLLASLTDKFGNVVSSSSSSSISTPSSSTDDGMPPLDENKLEKMLTTLLQVLAPLPSGQNGSNSSCPLPNIDALKRLPPKPIGKSSTLNFPRVDKLVNMIFDDAQDTKISPPKNGPIPHAPASTPVNESILSPKSTNNSEISLKWVKQVDTNFVNVSSICSSGDNGIIVVDERGVHEYDADLSYRQSREWSDWPQKNALVFPYLTAYHKDRNSVFVTREINAEKDVGCVNEYPLTGGLQQCSKKLDLPVSSKDEDFIAPRLISVLSDGRLVCASGLDGSASIWIKSFAEGETGKWTKAWSSGTLKKFLSLYVITTFDNGKEYLYIESEGHMYEFLLTKWKTRFIRSYEIRRSCYQYNFFVWNNQLYYLNKCDSRLCPCFECNHKECNLKEIDVENLNLTKQSSFICANSDGTLIYLLNSTDNKFYIGKVL